MKEPQDKETKTTIPSQKQKNIFCSQFISTLSTGLICTFISLGITSYIEDKNREINLQPLLDIKPSKVRYKNGYYGLVIRNTGKGPAIIECGHIIIKTDVKTNQIDIKEYINSNTWDTVMSELGVKYNVESKMVRSMYVQRGMNAENVCLSFYYSDYIPVIKSSIKDGDEFTMISFLENFELFDKKDKDGVDEEIFKKCKSSFNQAIKNGKLNIVLKYKSINGNEYTTNNTINFSF